MNWRGGALRSCALASLLALLAVLAVGCGGGSASHGSAPGSQPPTTEADRLPLADLTVARFSGVATATAGLADGHELLVTMQAGQVYRIRLEQHGSKVVPVADPHPVLDLSSSVSVGAERGLLGIVIARDGKVVYVDYTARNGAVTVKGYPYRPGAPLDPAEAFTVLSLPHPTAHHNGGALAFSLTGQLLVSLGDKGITGPGLPVAQDPTSPFGGIIALRLDPSGRPVGPAMQLAKGMRNPWRMSVDPDTGTIWVGDVGESKQEEIDTVPPTAKATVPNYGWPVFEGNGPGLRPDLTVHDPVRPVLAQHHDPDVCAVVGGVVDRSTRIPALDGKYLYGDLCSGDLRAFTVHDGVAVGDGVVASSVHRLISINAGPQGEIYLAGTDGAVLRLDPASGSAAPTAAESSLPQDDDSLASSSPDCALLSAFSAFGELASSPATSPATARSASAKVLAAIAAARTAGPASVQAEVRVISAGFTIGANQMAAVGWNLRDPKAQALTNATQNGDGPVPGFLSAIDALDDYDGAHCVSS